MSGLEADERPRLKPGFSSRALRADCSSCKRTHVFRNRRWTTPNVYSLFDSASFDRCESVGAPVLAAHAVMEEEDAVGVVFLLDALKARIVSPQKESCQFASK